jgi:probable F420-dependent oxidoreductase
MSQLIPGIVFPQTEIGTDPVVIRDFAQAAEAMGFRYVLAYDHVLGANPERPGGWRGPYTHLTPFHEPFVLFAYLSALTQTLEFVTGVLILPQRQTALVAKQAAQVQILSGGRLRVGIGIGWNKVEYDALGQDFGVRGRRSVEQVMLLRDLWTQPLITFQGEFDRIDDAGINPLPTHPIPVWFGGEADAVLRRMAQMGDGWIANFMQPEQGAGYMTRIREYLSNAGRDPSKFGIDIRVNLSRQPINEWETYLRGWQTIGATHAALNLMGAGLNGLDDYVSIMQQYIAMGDFGKK